MCARDGRIKKSIDMVYGNSKIITRFKKSNSYIE